MRLPKFERCEKCREVISSSKKVRQYGNEGSFIEAARIDIFLNITGEKGLHGRCYLCPTCLTETLYPFLINSIVNNNQKEHA